MLDFKNCFSLAVFLCGAGAVVFSKRAWYRQVHGPKGLLRSMDEQEITPVRGS